MFRRAIVLDSNFAQAWARLSGTRSSQYWFFYDRSEAALSEAKAAAERALRLRPDLPEPHVAMGYYYYWGKLDYDRALQELSVARERQPNSADLYAATAAVQRRQGRWAGAVPDYERAAQLNPRSPDAFGQLAETYLLVRKYDDGCSAADKAASIGPDIPYPRWLKIQCLVARDELPQARQTLKEGVDAVGFVQMSRPAAGVASIAADVVVPSFLLTGDSTYHSDLKRLTTGDLPDTAGLYSLKADMYRFRGEPGLERAYLDSALAVLRPTVKAHPDEANFHARLGLVYARLGRKSEAVSEGETAVKLLPVSREAFRGANLLATLAMIYATVGMPDKAVEQLQYLLSVPSQVSPGLLRNDPRWDPLRRDERFEKLLK
jgi:tetratricopeptide (TPR) repeat protein